MTLTIFLLVYGALATAYGLYAMGVESGERASERDGGVPR